MIVTSKVAFDIAVIVLSTALTEAAGLMETLGVQTAEFSNFIPLSGLYGFGLNFCATFQTSELQESTINLAIANFELLTKDKFEKFN